MKPSDVFQLIYVSTARLPLNTVELKALLAGSRVRNEAAGVTGILLYHDSQFMQVVEGREETVRGLYAKIEKDPRHFAITRVWEGHVPTREFPGYAMAFRDESDPTLLGLPGFSTLLNERPSSPRTSEKPTPVAEFIRTFRRVSGIDQ